MGAAVPLLVAIRPLLVAHLVKKHLVTALFDRHFLRLEPVSSPHRLEFACSAPHLQFHQLAPAVPNPFSNIMRELRKLGEYTKGTGKQSMEANGN